MRIEQPSARVDPSFLRRLVQQVNLLGDGKVEAANSAGTAAPTGGTWNVGDFVRKTDPAEAGAGGSKYVIIGWICTVAGTPGTWLECRCLTGN